MDLDNYWLSRATVRAYSPRPVPEELVNDLLIKASHAPTTGNMQLYSVVVTRDEAMKQALAPAHFSQPQVIGAQAVLTFCADFHRFSRWCEARGASPCYDNFQSFMAAVLDTVAFAQQFNTLAEMAGLGVCWLGTTTYNADKIADLLHLPALVVPVITLTVGWPAVPGVEVGRLPLEAVVHKEVYEPYSDDRIDVIYAEKEARSDSKRFVEENGKPSLAHVFTDVRYPRANNELFSDLFRTFLSRAGFLPA